MPWFGREPAAMGRAEKYIFRALSLRAFGAYS
jgi:hypothetical protein